MVQYMFLYVVCKVRYAFLWGTVRVTWGTVRVTWGTVRVTCGTVRVTWRMLHFMQLWVRYVNT